MKSVVVAAIALCLGIGTAIAGNTEHPNFDKKGNPPGFSEGKKTGWENGNEPPGWDKGQKQGWINEDSPPGLQKSQMIATTTGKTGRLLWVMVPGTCFPRLAVAIGEQKLLG